MPNLLPQRTRPTHRIRRGFRPSLILATAALVAATGGTAIAAGELITRADQIAPGVINSDHIRPHSIAKTDIEHPTLRLRVTSNGGLLRDTGDGTAERIGFGQYLVRFNRDAIDGGVGGAKNPRWLDHCAVVATPRKSPTFGPGSEPGAMVSVQPAGDPSAVVVSATEPDYELGRSVLHDAPFEIAAIC